jgi:hypothetical protein
MDQCEAAKVSKGVPVLTDGEQEVYSVSSADIVLSDSTRLSGIRLVVTSVRFAPSSLTHVL